MNINKERRLKYYMFSKCKGILHLGANVGQEAIEYAKLNKPVIWVEADPEIFEKLKVNIKKYNLQKAFLALLTDQDNEKYIFNIANNNGGSSSIFELGQWHLDIGIKYIKTKDLFSVKLSTMIEKNKLNVENYNMWVLDLQGAELKALIGAEKYLNYCEYLYIEFSNIEIYKGGVNFFELNNFLEDNNFKCLNKKLYSDIDVGNAIYIRR